MLRTFTLSASALALSFAAGPALAQTAPPEPQDDAIVVTGHPLYGTFGVDLTARDPNAQPGGRANPVTNPDGLVSRWCGATFVAKAWFAF